MTPVVESSSRCYLTIQSTSNQCIRYTQNRVLRTTKYYCTQTHTYAVRTFIATVSIKKFMNMSSRHHITSKREQKGEQRRGEERGEGDRRKEIKASSQRRVLHKCNTNMDCAPFLVLSEGGRTINVEREEKKKPDRELERTRK